MKFRIQTPKGWNGPSYTATDSDEAAEMAERDGFEVLDQFDDILVVADEEHAMPDDEKDQLDYEWNFKVTP